MEPYEKLKNLTESEKAKYFEVFLESIELANDDSNDPDKNTNKKLSLNTLFNNFASGHVVPSDGSPKKKQKTLDSWLIKPKATKKETGESSGALEESSDVILSSDSNNVSECLNSTQSNLNCTNDENSASSFEINGSCSIRLERLPYEIDKVYNNCIVKVVPFSQPEISESTSIVTRKDSSRSKKKCTESSQLSKSKKSTKCSILIDNISLNKSKKIIAQSHISNNCDANDGVSPESIVSECNSNVTLQESSDIILSSNTNDVSECLNSTQSKSNDSNDETYLSLSKIHDNSIQNARHSPCKSNNFVKDVQIFQSEISESTHAVTKKGNLRSKKKCLEPSKHSKPKNSIKSSYLNDNINLNKSNSVETQSHIANNYLVNQDVFSKNTISEHNNNVALEKSHDVILRSDTNDVSQCSDSTQSNSLNDQNSLSPSKINEDSLLNIEQMPCKSDKVSNSSVKEVQISQPEVGESPRIVTRTQSKRKCMELSQISKPENSAKLSTFTDNISSKRSKRISTQSHIINNCDVKHGASSENIVSESSNLGIRNDCSEIDSASSLNKGTRNLRSRKVSINLPSIPQSSTKVEQKAAKTLDVSKNISSPEKDNSIDSSLLSNWEAFHILEKECSRLNINILDILQDETVQNVLNNPNRLNNDTFFLFNSFKSSNERTLPVVHLIESWKKFSEIVKKLKQSS